MLRAPAANALAGRSCEIAAEAGAAPIMASSERRLSEPKGVDIGSLRWIGAVGRRRSRQRQARKDGVILVLPMAKSIGQVAINLRVESLTAERFCCGRRAIALTLECRQIDRSHCSCP